MVAGWERRFIHRRTHLEAELPNPARRRRSGRIEPSGPAAASRAAGTLGPYRNVCVVSEWLTSRLVPPQRTLRTTDVRGERRWIVDATGPAEGLRNRLVLTGSLARHTGAEVRRDGPRRDQRHDHIG